MKTQLNILEMDKDQLIAIDPDDVDRELSKIEMFHILRELGGYLEFNHGTLEDGKPEDHFELKSGLHSDLFINSKVVLQHENLRKMIAKQLVDKYQSLSKSQYNLDWSSPTCVAGIPNGAKLLGEDVADIFGARKVDLVKKDGKIKMISTLEVYDTLLFVEDICTKGTALKESENAAMKGDTSCRVLPFVLAIVNRGGLKKIRANSGFIFNIAPLYSIKANEWDEKDCYPCRMRSKSIKPKEIREVNLAV